MLLYLFLLLFCKNKLSSWRSGPWSTKFRKFINDSMRRNGNMVWCTVSAWVQLRTPTKDNMIASAIKNCNQKRDSFWTRKVRSKAASLSWNPRLFFKRNVHFWCRKMSSFLVSQNEFIFSLAKWVHFWSWNASPSKYLFFKCDETIFVFFEGKFENVIKNRVLFWPRFLRSLLDLSLIK